MLVLADSVTKVSYCYVHFTELTVFFFNENLYNEYLVSFSNIVLVLIHKTSCCPNSVCNGTQD